MLDLLRRNSAFRRVFLAQVVSYGGDWFANVALIGLLLHLTHSDLAATGVFVAATLPQFVAAPLAGPAADRFNRRTLMMVMSTLQAGAALTWLLIGHGTVWLAFVAQAGVAFLSAFFGPASQAAVPNLVDPEDLPTATAMMSATWGAMLAVGASLGGAFTVAFGRDAAFVADALTFVVAAVLIGSVRRPFSAAERGAVPGEARPRLRPIADTVEAIRYARQHPIVLALLASKMGFGLASGVVGLLAVVATRTFHSGDAGIGVLLGVRGIGVVLGPWVAWRVIGRGIERILLACGIAALIYAVAYALVPVAPSLAVAGILVLVAHLGGGAQWTLSTYGLQVETPDELRGRIFAADFALVTFTLGVSFFLAGWLSNAVGSTPVILGLAAVSAGWGAVYLSLTRRIRQPAPPVWSPAEAD